MPGIRDFSRTYAKFLGFGIFPGFSNFGISRSIFIPGIGIFQLRDIPGIFYFRDRDFFVEWDIPTKSHLCYPSFSPRLPRSFHEKVVFVILVCHLWESIEMVIRNPWSPGGLSRRGLSCYLQYT